MALVTLELFEVVTQSANHELRSLRISSKWPEGIDLKVFGKVLSEIRKVLHHFEQWGFISLRTGLILKFTYLMGGEIIKNSTLEFGKNIMQIILTVQR